MGKKGKNKEKKESPWKDIPAGYGVTIPTDKAYRSGVNSVPYRIVDKVKNKYAI